LSEASPYFLLLSATPHQGKSDGFHRLVSLLDKNAFPEPGSVTRERVHPYVIRTEKRQAIDADGNPLFKPRITKLVGVSWDGHADQNQLYDAVTEYVREGYNQAMREKKTYVGFLMILMQRLVTSSTRAIITTLEKRLTALQAPGEQLTMLPLMVEDEWNELDGQDQLESFLKTRLAALKNERAEVELLLTAARKVEARGPDAKAEALLEWIYKFQKEEGDPDVKLLVFTEFVPTQQMLAEFLGNRGISVACLNGSMSMDERQQVQEAFAKETRILISTDAGGEGLNLQFCHIIVNFDIPWNPMRIEQRIGRVDRIGQKSVVRAINFLFADSVEFRVRDVLESKLAIILEEFGVDKTSDVLDSAEAANLFDNLYVEALLHPDRIPQSVEQVTETIKARAGEAHSKNTMLANGDALSPDEARDMLNQPLAEWVEHALSGEQSTALVAGGVGVSAAGAGAHLGLERDGAGPGNGRQHPAQTLESGGASAGECAPGLCAVEQRLSAASALPFMPAAVAGTGPSQWLTPAWLPALNLPAGGVAKNGTPPHGAALKSARTVKSLPQATRRPAFSHSGRDFSKNQIQL